MTSDSSPQPISPLRARMIEDMSVRGFKEDTRRDYVRYVRAFAAFIGRSPNTATAEELRLFQLHQTRSGVQPPSINGAVSALRFFFTVTLDRPDLARRLTVVPYPRRIPTVLSVEEVTLLLQAASAPKYKAAFATAYGAGLRVSEVVALKVGDINSERMLLRVERGKGGPSPGSIARTRPASETLPGTGPSSEHQQPARLAESGRFSRRRISEMRRGRSARQRLFRGGRFSHRRCRRLGYRISTLVAPPPSRLRQFAQIEVDHRRRVERQKLRHQEAADDRDTKRPA